MLVEMQKLRPFPPILGFKVDAHKIGDPIVGFKFGKWGNPFIMREWYSTDRDFVHDTKLLRLYYKIHGK
jgi:hypothetical protein